MIEKIKKEKKYYYSILALIFVAIVIRIIYSIYHFTHYDDIGVATTLLEHNGNIFDWLTTYGWTYAPLQNFFVDIILDFAKGSTYLAQIFWGRFPSLIFGIGSVILTPYVIMKIFNNKLISIIGTIIIAFSMENIIYASQMEPYVIAVFLSMCIIYCLYKFIKDNKVNYFILVLLCTICCYAQYQLYIFVLFMYVILFIYIISKKKYRDSIRLIFVGIINLLLCIPMITLFLNSSMLQRGLSWNIGVDSAFLYQNSATNFIDYISYTVVFFTKNFFICVRSFFVSNSENLFVNSITLLLIIAFVIGIVALNRRKEQELRYLAYFFDFVLLINAVLILLGKLSFGPSRHILIFFPIILLCMSHGLLVVSKYLNFHKVVVYIFASCLIILGFYNTYTEFDLRENLYSYDYLEQKINYYNPDIICMYAGFDLLLMNFDDYYFDHKVTHSLGINAMYKEEFEYTSGSVLIFVGNEQLNDLNDYWPSFNDQLYSHGRNINKQFNHVGTNAFQLIEATSYNDDMDTEVEFASQYYDNTPNKLYIYILKIL